MKTALEYGDELDAWWIKATEGLYTEHGYGPDAMPLEAKAALLRWEAELVKQAQEKVVEHVAAMMGWEESRDHLAREFGLPDEYSHRSCTECNRGL